VRKISQDRLSEKYLFRKSIGLKIAVSCFLGSALICLIADAIGQYGMEAVLRFDLNWGSKYAYQTNSNNVVGSGIFRYFGVPIFDGIQHLGIRLPNFAANYTIHPLVFLSRYITTYPLTQLFVFLNISILFYFIALTFKSWDLKYWKTATIFSSTALSGTMFILLIHLDWAVWATTFCGIFTLTTVLVDKSLYVAKINTHGLHRVLAKIVFAFSALITSHPSGFFIAIPLFILIAIRFVIIKPSLRHVTEIVLVFVLMSIIAVIALIQILEKSFGEIRLPAGSLFDFFNYRASSPFKLIFYLTAAVLVSALQPIFWILGVSPHITSLSDFFAWPLLAGSLLFSIKRSTYLPKSIVSLRKNIVLVFFGYLLCSLLVGSVAKHIVFGASLLIRADGWAYAITLFGVVVISSPVFLFTSIQKSNQKFSFKLFKQTPVISALILVGLAVSTLYPVVALLKGPSRVASANYEQTKNSDGLSSVQRTSLRANRRFIFLKSEVFEGRRGLSSLQKGWLPILGIPHPLVLSRNGYPTPAGTSSYQDPGTLSDDFLGYTEFYTNQCSPRLYDFLGIDTIIADNQDKGCSGKIIRYFGRGSEIHRFQPEICYGLKTCSITTRLGEKNFTGLSVNAIQPRGFHSFYFDGKLDDNKSVCALENSSCLEKLQSDQDLKLNENPLKFCKQSCWINYDFKIPDNAQFLVIPINFDKSISVIDKDTKQSLKLVNIQGLVGVRTAQDQRIGTLEINIVADTKMKIWVLATYLHAVLLAYLVFLLFKTRVEVSLNQ